MGAVWDWNIHRRDMTDLWLDPALQTFGIKIGYGAGRSDGTVRVGEGQGPKAQASSCC